MAGHRIAESLTNAKLDIKGLERRAIFSFKEKRDESQCNDRSSVSSATGKSEYQETEEHELVYEAPPLEQLTVEKMDDTVDLEWHDIDSIPFDEMPADDRIWYPAVLEGDCMRGTFVFDGMTLIDHDAWHVPRIIQDVLSEAPNEDLNEMLLSDLKYLAVCSGLKHPKVSWQRTAPPKCRKQDLIRALKKIDRDHQHWRDDWFHGSSK
eukprot:CAMPEP_0184495356 /NCGR_PEP_ID=MMETSP0113_2-20130426/31062_1 /TAXON_ID=91329 /ORGANISM="Norrisiella sphaerica, Strain BC52" /LENGTH=207 /DNA_ID=CAMNT_0026881513 /DNA_START=272 /DNA_END=895 /DNA_ORIENTATION=+